MTNASLLAELFTTGRIKLRRGAIFATQPLALDLDDLRRNERVEGMLLGLAAGDALGHSTEWKYDADQRHREFGTIVDHVGNAISKPGRISDDTQFSFWTLESLLEQGCVDYEHLVRHFLSRRDRAVGMGRNTAGALARHADRMRSGSPALHLCPGDPAIDGRGNGTVMRLAPLVLPHLRGPVTGTVFRHRSGGIHHPRPSGGAGGDGGPGGHALGMPPPAGGHAPEPQWWLNEFVRIASDLEPWPPATAPANRRNLPNSSSSKAACGSLWMGRCAGPGSGASRCEMLARWRVSDREPIAFRACRPFSTS